MKTNLQPPLNVSGIFPSLALVSDLGPPRSECGVGGLMPWAGRLWVITYVSHKTDGVGTGLFVIDENLQMTRHPQGVVGTFTNRMIHNPTNQMIIGPHVVDAQCNVRTIESLTNIRICATMEHLSDPENKVYMLGMEGEFFEMDVHNLETRQLFDLAIELGIPERHVGVTDAHFKSGHTGFGRVVVANNSYAERDFEGVVAAGRLAEWDGKKWKILERTAFMEVHGRKRLGGTIFATGWDRASAILKVFTKGEWSTYRLPKASHTFDHFCQTEWTRIREVEHERFLMDCHGMFYELSPHAYSGKVWGIRPISTHLWAVPDFCSFRGMLVLGSDNASPGNGDNNLTAEPQSGLWFGKTDDLWNFGKPSGWGGPWWEAEVRKGVPSDPYLMTGFNHKVLHLYHDAPKEVGFNIEVDFLGNGTWKSYDDIHVGAGKYVHHEFPAGFSAHWVRLTPNADCKATAYLTYT